jgi:glycosyltransferase involved in cell wall biosynthesis
MTSNSAGSGYRKANTGSAEPSAPRASVLLSTYNHPDLLARSLLGFAHQTTLDFEIVVADDGSGPATREVVESFQKDFPVELLHVWQPDTGFHKSRAVNRAFLRSRASYLIFSDGDCVPARNLIEQHLAVARPGHYVVGGFVRLSEQVSAALGDDDVRSGRLQRFVTPAQWLDLYVTHVKSLAYIALGKRRKPKIFGLNFSMHRDDFVRVNGYDATYHNSSKEDSDLRNRMQVAGLRAISLWHTPGVFHQHHPPHEMRIAWKDAHAYYNRPELPAEAPVGLRELQEELLTSTKAL